MKLKRITAALLAAVMAASSVTVNVFADSSSEEVAVYTENDTNLDDDEDIDIPIPPDDEDTDEPEEPDLPEPEPPEPPVKREYVECTSLDDLQSKHPCDEYSDITYIYTDKNCKNLKIRFSENTEFDYYDGCFTVYDGDNNQIAEYTGTELAGNYVVVPGNTVMLRLTSDFSNNYYGFKVESVENIDYVPKQGDPEYDYVLTTRTDDDGNYGYYITRYRGVGGNIVIPSEIGGMKVTGIGSGAFSDCNEVTGITISNGVTQIYGYAFEDCSSLTSVTVSDSITHIEDCAFCDCTSLAEINVTAANSYYVSVNGVLYNKDKTAIICYPAGKKDKNYKILDNVTSIGTDAFKGCTSLTSVTIPDSVTSIGWYAFEECKSLTSIAIPDSVTDIGGSAFSYCTSLISITIPNSVTDIGNDTFRGCTSLTNITIPDGLIWIGDDAFYGCTSLTSITLPDSVTNIDDGAFWGCSNLTHVVISGNMRYVGDRAFFDCASLKSVTIPASVTNIGDKAFGYYYSDTGETKKVDGFKINYVKNTWGHWYATKNGFSNEACIVINECYDGTFEIDRYAGNDKVYAIPSEIDGNKITKVGDKAFAYCDELTSITIPESITSIRSEAFNGCTALVNINIPDSVISIGNDAFSDTALLENQTTSEKYAGRWVVDCDDDAKSVTIKNGTAGIADCAFYDCPSLTSVTIPNSVTNIGERAFGECVSLLGITIPNGVTSIDEYTFYNCTSLTSVTIPNRVTSIGDHAFKECASLASITIPGSITEIGYEAFMGCTSLKSVTIPASVLSIDSEAFGYIDRDEKVDDFKIDYVKHTEGHRYAAENGFTEEVYFATSELDDGSLRITGYIDNLSSVSLIIPSEVNGKQVTGIGRQAFEGCTGLENITIPDSVTSIGYFAFNGCTSLTSITIPDSVTSIGGSAFRGCTSLTSITIPDNVANIGEQAFYGSGLTTVKLSEKLTDIDVDAFAGTPIIDNQKTEIKYIGSTIISCDTDAETLTVGDDVTTIASNAFVDYVYLGGKSTTGGEGCDKLKSIIIPKNVKYIGEYSVGYHCYIGGQKSAGNYGKIDDFIIKCYSCYIGGQKSVGNYGKIDDFIIKCYSNSAAERYAKDNGFTYELLDKPTLSKVTSVKLGGRAADALRINWSKNANADGYIVEMYQNGKWERVAKITDSTTATFRKAGLKAGTVYKFRVKAYKMNGSVALYSEYSTELAARTNPSVMTGVKLGGRAADALRVNWTKNTSADGYIVEMYQGDKWVRAAKITSNATTTYRASGLSASTVYKFRVRAYKMSGKTALYGNYSATVTARTNPSVMTGAMLGGRAADALRINWSKNASADGYIVEMYQGDKWVRVAKITSNATTTYRASGLSASTVYKFRVRAYKMSGKTALYGNYSATVTARTNPSIVKGVKIGGKAKDALRVNWTKNSSAQGYIVEMYKGGKWVRVAKITNGNTTTFRKAGLAKNTAYKFRVRAYHMSGKTALYGNYGSVSGKTAAK